jgi:hypothetical protein
MNSTQFPRHYTLVIIAAWAIIIIGLMLINLRQTRVARYAMATIDARSNIDEDIAFRLWVSSHGASMFPWPAEFSLRQAFPAYRIATS